MTHDQRPASDRRAGFNMIEMTCALGIFVGVSAAFYASSNTLSKFLERLAWQSEAASVFDNTLARVVSRQTPTVDQLTMLFNDEFKKGAQAIVVATRPATTIRGDHVYLEIIDDQGHIVAELVFPLEGSEQ